MDPGHKEDLNSVEGDGNGDGILDESDIDRVIDFQDNGEGGDEMETDEEAEGADGGEGEEAPVDDKAAVVFTTHTEKPHPADEPPEVYAVHIDHSPSNSGLVVTGGRDDTAYVWFMNSGQVLFECTGHKNSVTCVAFSHDGMYVASADLDGLIKVWQCEPRQEVWSYECGSDITWIHWHHAAHVLLAGTQGGEVWMWQVPKWSKMKMFQSHGHPSLCGKILANGKSACVGYGDGAVKLWDLASGNALHSWQHATMPEEDMAGDDDNSADEDGEKGAAGEGNQEEEEVVTSPVAILSIDCSTDNSLVISGCADSTAKVFNVSSGKLLSTFKCAVNRDQDNSVESVAFCPVASYAATATNSGAVEIWDLPTSVVRQTLQHPEGVSKLMWSTSSSMLYTACLDGITRVWDARNGAPKAVLTGHGRNSCVLDFDVTRDGTCLVSASEDGTARVFDLRFMQS